MYFDNTEPKRPNWHQLMKLAGSYNHPPMADPDTPPTPVPEERPQKGAASFPQKEAAPFLRKSRSRGEDKVLCERCGAEMFRMHAVWRCPQCRFKTDCCGW